LVAWPWPSHHCECNIDIEIQGQIVPQSNYWYRYWRWSGGDSLAAGAWLLLLEVLL